VIDHPSQAWIWAGFLAFVVTMLALDLFVLNRKASVVSVKKAMIFTAFFAGLGLLFTGVVYLLYQQNIFGFGEAFTQRLTAQAAARAGVAPSEVAAWIPPADSAIADAITNPGRKAATLYITGWLVEYALSMDNIFVMAVIFAHFRVPQQFQHRVLFWGILGAIILRGVMIALGATLVREFHFVLYCFGAFLVYAGFKLAFSKEEGDYNPESTLAYRLGKRLFPLSPNLDGQKFFTMENGVRKATPLLLVLLVIEGTDVVFAVDSIPAIFAITDESFLVFTSNIFEIMGLRSLYFALSGAMNSFKYLKHSLAFILAFVGVKMLLPAWDEAAQIVNRKGWGKLPVLDWHISPEWSLSIIVVALALGVAASIAARKPRPSTETKPQPNAGD
jgi:tellurite resistance protein TerC